MIQLIFIELMSIEASELSKGFSASTVAKPDLVPSALNEYQSPGKIEKLLNHIETKLNTLMILEFPGNYKSIMLEKMKDPRIVPFIYSNHYDLANGMPLGFMAKTYVDLANTVRDPNDPFLGFVMGVSTTLFDGKQGSFMQTLIRQLKIDFLKKYNTQIVGCTTRNDVEKRNVESQERTALLRTAIGFAHAGNGGVALFPEATVEGGRRFEDGEYKGRRKGLQNFDDSVSTIIRSTAKYDREWLFIPLSLDGPNLLHTDHRRLTVTALKTLASKNPKPVFHVKVGRPTTQTELATEIARNNGGREVSNKDMLSVLRRMVACQLPTNFLPPEEKR